jgi:hypothetical protein
MRKEEKEKEYFFVDESGDPTFYNRFKTLIVGKEGCSKILMLGFVKTENPEKIRKALTDLRKEISADEYLKSIPSFGKSMESFHAKDDCPEIREKVFKLIKKLNFRSEFIVARKIENIFNKKYKRRESSFYDDLIVKLFENKLHIAKNNYVYFAKRGNNTRQIPLEEAIDKAILRFEEKWDIKNGNDTKVFCQLPSHEPCLQVVDYMNWAIQRAFIRGESRYYNFVKEKVGFICDVYDFDNYPKNFYNKKNEFSVNKISPL